MQASLPPSPSPSPIPSQTSFSRADPQQQGSVVEPRGGASSDDPVQTANQMPRHSHDGARHSELANEELPRLSLSANDNPDPLSSGNHEHPLAFDNNVNECLSSASASGKPPHSPSPAHGQELHDDDTHSDKTPTKVLDVGSQL